MQEVSQICPPHCAFPYRLWDEIVHYSEMSKTRKSPRKSFPEHWEPSQKRAGTVFPNKWGKSCTAACPFFGDTSEAVLYRPIGAYSVLPQTGNGSRWHIQPSEFRTFVLISPMHFCEAMRHVHGTLTPRTQKPRRAACAPSRKHLQNMGGRGTLPPHPHSCPVFGVKMPCHPRIW